MATTAAGIASTTVTTDQQAPLGFELEVPTANAGTEVWVYVKAEAALTAGKIVMLEDAALTGSFLLGASASSRRVMLPP